MRLPRICTVALLVSAASPALAGEPACQGVIDSFDRAVAARSIADAKRLESVVSADLVCVDLKSGFRARRAQLEVKLAADANGPLRSEAEREAVLVDAADHSDLWVAEEHLGDLLSRSRRWREAAARYDEAIAKGARFSSLDEAEKQKLLEEAGAAKMLASDDAEGTRPARLATSSRAAGDGRIGGIYSPMMRGARPVSVPVPIQFETNSAELTSTGRQALDELLQASKEQGVPELRLVGHTDPRGADAYNVQLSARRLASVKAYATVKDASLRLTLVPKGSSEPFDTSLLPFTPTREEAWALDRRVDWVR